MGYGIAWLSGVPVTVLVILAHRQPGTLKKSPETIVNEARRVSIRTIREFGGFGHRHNGAGLEACRAEQFRG